MKTIYLDNAATTHIRPEVFDEMLPYLKESFGNASSIYSIGREARKAVEKAREQVAKALHCKSSEIFFTGGGSESDNWAVKSTANANREKGMHIITSAIEHHAVLNACKFLEKNGYEISYIPVDNNGIVKIDELKKAIRKDTTLISVMYANNEIGTIQPIEEIGKIAKEHNIYFHTDAVQAVGNIPIDLGKLDIDLLSLSGHKIYGPKGVGVLYIKEGTKIASFIHGGGQEKGKRAGTENVAGIVGLGKAIELATKDIETYSKHIQELRDMTIDGILKNIPHCRLNGDRGKRLPGNVNISFEYIEGESILLMLDSKGICASSGSACTSGSLDPSHVLLAIGLPHEIAHGSLRLTFGIENSKDDVKYILETLPPIIEKLRDMSPLYNKQ